VQGAARGGGGGAERERERERERARESRLRASEKRAEFFSCARERPSKEAAQRPCSRFLGGREFRIICFVPSEVEQNDGSTWAGGQGRGRGGTQSGPRQTEFGARPPLALVLNPRAHHPS
jgi:hypothetical protein